MIQITCSCVIVNHTLSILTGGQTDTKDHERQKGVHGEEDHMNRCVLLIL